MTSVSEYRTKSQIILDTVRTRIMRGDLGPGTRLVIRSLADDFACSDIPVREALRTLESEGLVLIVPHGGARVTGLDGRALIELTEARALLEPEATVAAARVMPSSAVRDLERLVGEMRSGAAQLSRADYGKLNRVFHMAILAHCPNVTLTQLITDLWDRSERGRAVHQLFDGHVDTSVAQHAEIVRSISKRDFDEVRKLATAHSAHGLAAIRRLVEENDNRKRLEKAGA